MGKGCLSFFLLCLVPLLILPAPAGAIWVENGKAVCAATGAQRLAHVVPDDNGGSIIAWVDGRSAAPSEVYAQRVDEYGTDIWASDGVQVFTGSSIIGWMHMISDGASGAFIAVHTSDDFLHVQRIYADGTLWSLPGGTSVCSYAAGFFDSENISMALDGGGGVIAAWDDLRSFPDLYIYAQRLDASGTVKWAANGVPICSAANFRLSPRCASDFDGGTIITWTDERTGAKDIYAQRIDSTGTVLWTVDGVPVCTASGAQQNPRIIPDGEAGAIIAWEDQRASVDIYLQRLDSGGIAQWTTDGVAATTAIYSQVGQRLVSDGEGGAIVTWLDTRNTLINADVYAQRVSSAGTVLWETDGAPVCTADEIQGYPRIAEDGDGGAVIAWKDSRVGNRDIYAQRIGPDGAGIWEENGDTVCTGQIYDREPSGIAYVGLRGVAIAWLDGRNGSPEMDTDIYAQGLDFQGNWGYPSPVIYSVEDVPGDQGGYINLFWYASVREDLLYDDISHYTLWRAVEPQQAMAAFDMGAALIEGPAELSLAADSRVIRQVETEAATYFWELVGTQDTYRFEAYAMAIPTLFDSTEIHHACHYFQVLAHRSSNESYYESGVDSAYSVDNLSPAVPIGLAGEQSYTPGGLQLTWVQNGEEDLAGYNVYRGASEGFVPGPGNRIASTSAAAVFDDEWSWDGGYWYKVAAVDVNGNEGEYAMLSPDMVTGDDPMPLPDAPYLEQNFPHPFNPSTNIRFGIKEQAYVSLRIYDAAGRLVTTLLDETRPSGSYTAEWNGLGTDGRAASSGVYFYRLRAGEFEETKKMILLR